MQLENVTVDVMNIIMTITVGVKCAPECIKMHHFEGQNRPTSPSQTLGRGHYCRCVGESADPWPRITVSDSVALCGGMTVLSAPRSPVSLGVNQAVRL